MMVLDILVLTVVFAAVFFYVLYGVIRAAVRDGILQADERRQQAGVGVNSSGDGA
ncbi:hypothetical protein [Pseudarthrobacter sp. fls2-241-R2A-168]|jgi:hypothetical protein|uniref:hypothetical protein n=1 Tax=Pseudarthrobacter sp. fls2-241-R2A-168 TaxID=3040304 RepID=UPI002552BB98|nr:hypothetical protein [Pseudarthrobacter sp. fls2-241-R2A-168]